MKLITDDGIMIEWVSLGEGMSGDYNPDDPEDVELLRFDVSISHELARKHGISGEVGPGWRNWVQPRDTSYCTQVPSSTNERDQAALLGILVTRIREGLDTSLKRTCESLSWINPSWLDEVRRES